MVVADGHSGSTTTAVDIPCVTLNMGHAMLVLGFDTRSSCTPDNLPATILHTVWLSVVASRVDIFVTSKLWIPDTHPAHVVPALRQSLARLGLDYLDLFLVHWPVAAAKKDPAGAHSMGDLVPLDMEGIWHAMEECHHLYSKSRVPPPVFQERRATAACVAMAAALWSEVFHERRKGEEDEELGAKVS